MSLKYRVLTLFLVALLGLGIQAAQARSELLVSPTADREVRASLYGSGDRTLVFIHCWTCGAEMWEKQINAFKDDYRVVAITLPGHGREPVPKNNTIEAYAEDVIYVLDSLNISKVTIVGHSMGGPIAYEVFSERPELVMAIVGVDTFNLGGRVPVGDSREAMFKEFKTDYESAAISLANHMFVKDTPSDVRKMVLSYFLSANRVLATESLEAIFSWYDVHSYDEIQMRLNGLLWNINAGSERGGCGGRTLCISNVGHFPAQEAPDRFNQALKSILKSIEETSLRAQAAK